VVGGIVEMWKEKLKETGVPPTPQTKLSAEVLDEILSEFAAVVDEGHRKLFGDEIEQLDKNTIEQMLE
jgi:hypothetical protein